MPSREQAVQRLAVRAVSAELRRKIERLEDEIAERTHAAARQEEPDVMVDTLPLEPAITNIGAAQRQLSMAIELYFEDRDSVSVHTLAMAAAEIIDKECAAKGLTTIRAGLMAEIKPEHQKEVSDAIGRPKNFFKHGSGGPVEDFADDRNDMALFMACHGLALLGADTVESRTYINWFNSMMPELLLPPLSEFYEKAGRDLRAFPRPQRKEAGLLLLRAVRQQRALPSV